MGFSLVWEGFCPRGTPRAMDMGTAGWPCTRQPVKPVNTIALMATILRLPYTTAIRPSLRGGFLYVLPCLCTISACTLLLQCAESTTHPALPCRPRSPALCRHDPERRG